ncbi:MAG: anthranilate synthase component I [Verrucomicrobiales bacterium]|nr:anthranilate synthase component I [Verrucomicrobiales bacterium]
MYSPSREEFRALAAQGNLIPVCRRLLADFETPLSAYTKIRGQGESFLLESVEGGEHLGRYSFVGCSPRAVVRQAGDRVEVLEGGKVAKTYRVVPGAAPGGEEDVVRDGLEVVQRVMAAYRPVELPNQPRFTGGAIGYLAYEFIHDIEPVVPRPPRDELGTPVLYFLIADQVLVFDRVAQTLSIVVNAFLDGAGSVDDAYEDAVGEIERIVSLLEQPIQGRPASFVEDVPEVEFTSNQTLEQFQDKVVRSKDYIRAGDIFQVVGSQRFSAPLTVPPMDLYRALRSVNPSPYMFLLELEGLSLVGASPEIHVRCENRCVEIRPIAGTRKRGRTEAEDLELEKELLADPKERAEHVMLIDLARNDVGRVCDFGTVSVKDLMIIERYSHVMHIVSQVEGRLSADRSTYDLMRATFPAGTLTGAPKIRAMQIIAEFEQTARGPYGGCVGYFSFSGNLDCCITIRTAVVKDGRVHVQAGGGWVHDSTPEGEYQETVNKSRAVRKAVAVAEAMSRES